MPAPPIDTSPNMFCRHCGYALIGLPSNRCPECGRNFDPANPKSFRAHPRRRIWGYLVKIVVALFCLTLPADAYLGYLLWQVHREEKAIEFLTNHRMYVDTYDTTPHWAKVLLRGRAAWLWKRAGSVEGGGPWAYDNASQLTAAVGNLKSLRELYLSVEEDSSLRG